MARKKKEEAEKPAEGEQIFPNGTHFGIIQLERDLSPKPAAQRIVQFVNRDGKLQAYVSENAYQRSECIDIFDKLYRYAYQQSISKGSVALLPVKGRLHWHRFTAEFCIGKPSERVSPETDKAEEPEE